MVGNAVVAVATLLVIIRPQAVDLPTLHYIDMRHVFFRRIDLTGQCRPDLAAGLGLTPVSLLKCVLSCTVTNNPDAISWQRVQNPSVLVASIV